jgi:ABC-type nitrate/sulfonate/bicarbonate transport system permease component
MLKLGAEFVANPLRRILVGAGPLLAVGMLWEIASRLGVVNSLFLPPVSRILGALVDGVVAGTLPRALIVTCGRFVLGYLAAAFFGVTIGFLMGRYRALYALLGPLVEVMRPIPSAALIPIAILFLGIADSMKIAVIAIGSLWPILLNALEGVREIDPLLIDTGRTLRLSPVQLDAKLVLPAALPFVFAGLRISLGVALILAITVEMISGESGLGFLVIDCERSFRYPLMYAGVLTLGVLGFCVNYGFVGIQKRVLFWSNQARLDA